MDAREIKSWVESAAYDGACSIVADFKQGVLDEETKSKIQKLKDDGVTDLIGAHADQLYNDPDFLEDMLGDSVYDSANTGAGRLATIDELSKLNNYKAWNDTIAKLKTQKWE